MTALASLITARQPQLEGVFGFVDGLNLPILQPLIGMIQNASYNLMMGGLPGAIAVHSSSSGQMGVSCGARCDQADQQPRSTSGC